MSKSGAIEREREMRTILGRNYAKQVERCALGQLLADFLRSEQIVPRGGGP